MNNLTEKLLESRDSAYCEFQRKLIPNIAPETVIGVRAPQIRKIAKTASADEKLRFLDEPAHKYYDENALHGCIINEIGDFSLCVKRINEFLPYVDNWAVCDGISPKIFKKHRAELLEQVKIWLKSEHIYTLRFAVRMLMNHFLEEDFSPEYPQWVSQIHSEEYYLKMMQAWYFATALAKRYDEILPFITEKKLDTWVHNKSIQKAVESYRITPEQKEFLRSLKIK